MKNCRSLFDLCPVREGARNGKTVKITAMSYLRPCDDKEQRMEDRLLQTSEYILLRGKGDGSWPGLLREVRWNQSSPARTSSSVPTSCGARRTTAWLSR